MPGSSSTTWTAAYTRQVAENIRHHRRRQGLSVQNVADRCAAQGLPLERNNLAKLESGHRASLTVAELLVLARALNTPPVLLLTPLGRSTESVEILPGVDADPGEAVFWLDGTAPLPDTPYEEGAGARAELQALRTHRLLVGEWTARARAAAEARGRANDETEPLPEAWREAAHGHAEQAAHAAERIGHLRDNMRLRGLPLPDLPPGLIHLDLWPE
ncbi:helix-turn-helix domain-containing protein [Nonomuraea sp. NPDC052265]|uniref:helix-turn-helix domain-containing protein n=1 Tax=Nonomuraea sp. NPDC052265 TaxID=3364374 RepID=UPI0037C614D2